MLLPFYNAIPKKEHKAVKIVILPPPMWIYLPLTNNQ